VLLVLAGLLVAGTARQRWRAVDDAMRRGAALPYGRTPTVVTIGVLAAGALALLLVVLV